MVAAGGLSLVSGGILSFRLFLLGRLEGSRSLRPIHLTTDPRPPSTSTVGPTPATIGAAAAGIEHRRITRRSSGLAALAAELHIVRRPWGGSGQPRPAAR